MELTQLSGRDVLLQVVPTGIEPARITWRRASLSAPSQVGLLRRKEDASSWRLESDEGSPDVVLYVVDTLRADSLGSYGSAVPTPNIDGLAKEGVRFTRALTPASWTRPATASLFTGLYPSSHRAEDRAEALPEAALTLAERLRLRGYSTIAVVGNGNVDSVYGFDQGFEVFLRPEVPDRDSPEGQNRFLDAEDIHNVAVSEWRRSKSSSDRPVFLYVHIIDPHGPYDPPEWSLTEPRPDLDTRDTESILIELNTLRRVPTTELVAALRTLYDAEVAYVDRAFGNFYRDLSPAESTIVVFTSDHGEAFQEHGMSSHGMSLYGEEISIPMILRAPGRLPAGATADEVVSLVDVVPTVVGLLGVSVDGVQGVDLGRMVRSGHSKTTDRPVLAELDYDGRLWRALHYGSKKLMLHSNSKRLFLYDLRKDPREMDNRAATEQHVAAELLGVLEELVVRTRRERIEVSEEKPDTPMPPDLLENLRALGYVQ